MTPGASAGGTCVTGIGALTDVVRPTGDPVVPGNGVLHNDGLMLGMSLAGSCTACGNAVEAGRELVGSIGCGGTMASLGGEIEDAAGAAGWIGRGTKSDALDCGVIGVLHTDLGMLRSPDTSFSRSVDSGAGQAVEGSRIGLVISEVRMSCGKGMSESSPGATTPPEVRFPFAKSHSQTTHGLPAGWM